MHVPAHKSYFTATLFNGDYSRSKFELCVNWGQDLRNVTLDIIRHAFMLPGHRDSMQCKLFLDVFDDTQLPGNTVDQNVPGHIWYTR